MQERYEINTYKEAVNISEMIKFERPPFALYKKNIGPPRGLQLNNYYHGVLISTFANHVGLFDHEAKAYIAILFLTVAEMDASNPDYVDKKQYNLIQYLGTIYVTKKTSKLTEKEMMDHVDKVLDWMVSTVGIDVLHYRSHISEL